MADLFEDQLTVATTLVSGDYVRILKSVSAVLESENISQADFLTWINSNISSGFPKGHSHGLTLSNNATDATNDIDVAIGEARDSTNAVDITLASALTKRLDAAWSVGTNQGGLDTGSIASTTYHLWLIKRSDTGVVDVLFSTSASAPVMPTNYDYKWRIGSIMRESGVIVPFNQDGDDFTRDVPIASVNATNPGTSAVTRTLHVPIGIRVKALVAVNGQGVTTATDNPQAIFISDLAIPDSTPGTSLFNAFVYNGGAVNNSNGFMMTVFTNTSAQVRSRVQESTANTNLRIVTHGWTDTRGRLA